MTDKMTGGEALVQTLIDRDVDTVFFVPGGTYVTVLEALSRHTEQIRCVPMRLESSAMFAAEAYAVVRRKPACVMVSRAPGACNAAIGVHTAQQGSRPVLLMIANIPKALKQREAFQEIDYAQFFPSVAKACYDVHGFDDIAPVVARALDQSVSARPGPVVVTVSKDVLDGVTGEPRIPPASARVRSAPDADTVRQIVAMLQQARHPVIIAGEMVNFEAANESLQILAERAGAGVMAAYRQQDVFDNTHPAWMGQLTLNRTPHMERALAQCDLLISIGTRLDSVTTADYTMVKPQHRLVMIYPEPDAFAQHQPQIAVSATARDSIETLSAAITTEPGADRLAWRERVHSDEKAFSVPGEINTQGDVDMAQVVDTFKQIVKNNTRQVTDAGTFGRWNSRYYQYQHPATSIGPVSGAMGYGVPGGIGAAVGDPTQPVVVWVGDGGFLMTGNEAAVMVQEQLSIIIIVCDNSAWGSIMTHQNKRFPGWDFGTRLKSPDFAVLAQGYGMASFPVHQTSEFEPALKQALSVNGPALIHLHLDIRDASPFVASQQ